MTRRCKTLMFILFNILALTPNSYSCGKSSTKIFVVNQGILIEPYPLRSPEIQAQDLPVNNRLQMKWETNTYNDPNAIHILVVDDQLCYHKYVKQNFRIKSKDSPNSQSFFIHSALNGEEAIKIIERHKSRKIPIHAMLMDFDMGDPDHTGVDTLNALREACLIDFPTVIFAHSSEPTFNSDLMTAGATLFIDKGQNGINYHQIILSAIADALSSKQDTTFQVEENYGNFERIHPSSY